MIMASVIKVTFCDIKFISSYYNTSYALKNMVHKQNMQPDAG